MTYTQIFGLIVGALALYAFFAAIFCLRNEHNLRRKLWCPLCWLEWILWRLI
jgi:hypothetical protein